MVNGWSTQKLSDLSSMKSGLGITEANIEKSGSYPCYGGNGLRGYTSEYTHDGQLALIGRQGALCGNVTLVSGKFYASEHAVVVMPKSNADIVFLSYVLKDMRLNQYSESSAQPGLSVNKVLEIECFAPNDKTEQRAIAAALSEADEYIAALEKLLAKKRAVKQGAMQELLTGKRRLPGFKDEWVEKRIDDFGVLKSGNGFPLVYQGGHTGYPFYKVSDFSNEGNERTMSRANNYVTQQVASILNCNIIPQHSILFAKIGAAVFLERKRMVAADCCIDNNMMAFIVDETKGYAPYLCYLMQTISFGDLVTATALPSLSAKSIGEIHKQFPPTKDEQIAIATILSDMDAEIDTLTAKLEKARLIKQGMMSELLTGRIRLIEGAVDNGEN